MMNAGSSHGRRIHAVISPAAFCTDGREFFTPSRSRVHVRSHVEDNRRRVYGLLLIKTPEACASIKQEPKPADGLMSSRFFSSYTYSVSNTDVMQMDANNATMSFVSREIGKCNLRESLQLERACVF